MMGEQSFFFPNLSSKPYKRWRHFSLYSLTQDLKSILITHTHIFLLCSKLLSDSSLTVSIQSQLSISTSRMNAGNMICVTALTLFLIGIFITSAHGAPQWWSQEKRSCASKPCLNGGYCIDKDRSERGYLCNCPAQYTGHSCESRTRSPVNCAFRRHGNYPNPTECPSENYFACTGGGWLMRCDIGTFYNARSNSCLFIDQVQC